MRELIRGLHRRWELVDGYRLDKFLSLVRFIILNWFKVLSSANWDQDVSETPSHIKLVEDYSELIYNEMFDDTDKDIGI